VSLSVPIYKNNSYLKVIFLGGLLLLLFPPLGWLCAIGYRRSFGLAYAESRKTKNIFVWPDYFDNIYLIFINGIKSYLVIMSYLLPSILLGWFIVLNKVGFGKEQACGLLLFTVGCLVFLPVGLPTTTFLLLTNTPWFSFSPLEGFIVLVVFLMGIFLIPSAFINVSIGKGFIDGLTIRGHKIILEKPLGYIKTWSLAIINCFGVLLFGPFATFGIFWSYQKTVQLFADLFSEHFD
jgi:hypothetical protein